MLNLILFGWSNPVRVWVRFAHVPSPIISCQPVLVFPLPACLSHRLPDKSL